MVAIGRIQVAPRSQISADTTRLSTSTTANTMGRKAASARQLPQATADHCLPRDGLACLLRYESAFAHARKWLDIWHRPVNGRKYSELNPL
jgi:hypothetical protein